VWLEARAGEGGFTVTMAARGEAIIREGRSDECVGARRSDEWEGCGGQTLQNMMAARASSHVHWPIFFN